METNHSSDTTNIEPLIGRPLRRGHIYCFANQKGGVGKTTTTVNMAAYLAVGGKRVLLVDADSQANATSSLSTFNCAIIRSSIADKATIVASCKFSCTPIVTHPAGVLA